MIRRVLGRWRRRNEQKVWASAAGGESATIAAMRRVHTLPPPGESLTTCCGRSLASLPWFDYYTTDRSLVTCMPWEKRGEPLPSSQSRREALIGRGWKFK